jgi:hypothetical protein
MDRQDEDIDHDDIPQIVDLDHIIILAIPQIPVLDEIGYIAQHHLHLPNDDIFLENPVVIDLAADQQEVAIAVAQDTDEDRHNNVTPIYTTAILLVGADCLL